MKNPKVLAIAGVVLLAGIAYLAGRGFFTVGSAQQQVKLLDPAQVIVVRTPGGLLEVAKLSRVEEFGWQTKYTCPLIDCGTLLGATITRVRVPVHYTYRVPLAPTWELRLQGKEYVLVVPAVEPALPVAVDTAKIQLETKGGWSSPSSEPNVQSTLRQLGPELERRATQPEYLAMQEPSAAQTVAEFAQKWMREQGKPLQANIRVIFKSGGA